MAAAQPRHLPHPRARRGSPGLIATETKPGIGWDDTLDPASLLPPVAAVCPGLVPSLGCGEDRASPHHPASSISIGCSLQGAGPCALPATAAASYNPPTEALPGAGAADGGVSWAHVLPGADTWVQPAWGGLWSPAGPQGRGESGIQHGRGVSSTRCPDAFAVSCVSRGPSLAAPWLWGLPALQ